MDGRGWAAMKRFAKKLTGLLVFMLPFAFAQASPELARSKFCMNCHGFGGTIVGPGYRAIAARRAGEAGVEQVDQERAALAMAARIQHGSQGQWGQTAMPANAVSAEEALQLARWILSLAPAVTESNGGSSPER